MNNLMSLIIAAALLSCASALAQQPMLGTWENVTNGDTVGIKLYPEGKCDIYIERAYNKRSLKTCKYEPFEQQFVVFLVKADGSCGHNPDFEFDYEPEAPLVRLYIQGSPMHLSKVE